MAKQEKMVKICKGDQEKEVPESEVSFWQSKGWRKVQDQNCDEE